MKYKVCEECGAHLDANERCDCKARRKEERKNVRTKTNDNSYAERDERTITN